MDLSCDLATQVRHVGKGVFLVAKMWLTSDSCCKTVLFSYDKCVYQMSLMIVVRPLTVDQGRTTRQLHKSEAKNLLIAALLISVNTVLLVYV